jgi:hypothetical protein
MGGSASPQGWSGGDRAEISDTIGVNFSCKNAKKAKSPLKKIKGIKTNITMDDILEVLRDSREGRK